MKIRKISSQLNISPYDAAAAGAYSSNTVYFDIATKKLEKFNFEYDNLKKLNKNNPASFKDDFGFPQKKLNKHETSKNHFVSLNSKAYGDGFNYHEVLKAQAYNKTEAYLENMNHIVHDLVLPGDFELSVGKIIELNLPKATIPEKDEEGNFQDKYLSGKHLVTSITHSFENKYTMNITCCKDSLLFDLEA